MIVETKDSLMVKGKIFPRIATREKLENCGAIYLESKNPKNGESKNRIERMVFENTTYVIVWERKNGNENDPFAVHYYSDNIKRI